VLLLCKSCCPLCAVRKCEISCWGPELWCSLQTRRCLAAPCLQMVALVANELPRIDQKRAVGTTTFYISIRLTKEVATGDAAKRAGLMCNGL
jgi:hypothetical protein